jgi:putative two-component system response regulator
VKQGLQAAEEQGPMETTTTSMQPHTGSYATLAFADSNAALAQLGRYTADLKRLVREREQVLRQIEQAHLNSLTLLSRAAEYRDDDTGVHMDRVGSLSQLLARLMGRSESELRMIRVAAPMHDIGKIAIPDAVLKKPGGYTPEERKIMNKHTVFGA